MQIYIWDDKEHFLIKVIFWAQLFSFKNNSLNGGFMEVLAETWIFTCQMKSNMPGAQNLQAQFSC